MLNYPTLDLHGEYQFSAKILVEEFIADQIILHNSKFCIVHGIGSGTLRKMVNNLLAKDERIKNYYLDFFNPGCTIVEIKEKYL